MAMDRMFHKVMGGAVMKIFFLAEISWVMIKLNDMFGNVFVEKYSSL